MTRDEYDQLKYRIRGPIFAAQEYLDIITPYVAVCNEGKELAQQAKEKLLEAQTAAAQFIAYAARMNGFED